MLSCDGELKADEYLMSAETSWIRDLARGRRDKWWTSVQGFEGQSSKFKPYTSFYRKPVGLELFEKFI